MGGVTSVIIDAIRLHDTHKFPKGHGNGTVDFDATAFDVKTTEFTCDDAACSTDPYIVLGREFGTYEHVCKWSEGNSTSLLGTIETDGAKNGTDAVFTGSCESTDADAGSIASTNIKLPGKVFPQFYAYGITTFSKDRTRGGLPNTLSPGRRLGGSRAPSPAVESKTIFVAAPQRVVAK